MHKVFPFILVYRIYSMNMKGYGFALYDFQDRIAIGYGVCFAVLFYSGIVDLIMGRWRSRCLNLGLAALSVWMLSVYKEYPPSA